MEKQAGWPIFLIAMGLKPIVIETYSSFEYFAIANIFSIIFAVNLC
jgi:hypothetical protein